MTKNQNGFTLVELMVVIVIISVLSALAVPRFFGVSAKSKAAEAPGIIANWETLQSAYSQENSTAGSFSAIGFQDPSSSVSGISKWFDYTTMGVGAPSASIIATTVKDFGLCLTGDTFQSDLTIAGDLISHTSIGDCAVAYTTNFLP